MKVYDFRFMFDRCCINNDETPKALEMEQDNVIEVYQEQTQLHDLALFLMLWESRHQ